MRVVVVVALACAMAGLLYSGAHTKSRAPARTESAAVTQGDAALNTCIKYWRSRMPDCPQLHRLPLAVIWFEDSLWTPCLRRYDAEVTIYCPENQTIYVSIAAAYRIAKEWGSVSLAVVLAHEVGHHVQYCLGLWDALQAKAPDLAHDTFMRMVRDYELQCDAAAGAWASSALAAGQIATADLVVAAAFLASLGDEGEGAADWPHGSPEERRAAFLSGTSDPGRVFADSETTAVRDLESNRGAPSEGAD